MVLGELPVTQISPDPKDHPILAIPIASETGLIVSGDKRNMRSLGRVRSIPICLPSKTISCLRGSAETELVILFHLRGRLL